MIKYLASVVVYLFFQSKDEDSEDVGRVSDHIKADVSL